MKLSYIGQHVYLLQIMDTQTNFVHLYVMMVMVLVLFVVVRRCRHDESLSHYIDCIEFQRAQYLRAGNFRDGTQN